MQQQPLPPTTSPAERPPPGDARLAARPAPPSSDAPNVRFVVKTLDAEMGRLELAVTRSGWTSWAGTAALAALAWIFIGLLETAGDFSWLRFAQLVTLLSLIQDFIYSVEYNLRPRHGFGLLAGSELRVLRTTEALPYARPEFLFYLVRAAFLGAASYLLLPELVGGWWLAPFIIYVVICLAMGLMLVVSTGDYVLPKYVKAPVGELVGAGIALAVACLGLDALLATWQDGDLPAFKTGLVAIAAVHVLRGLTAPHYELPALEQLQNIRRQLGFGQLSALAAVGQAEAALVGHMALTFLAEPLSTQQELTEKLEAETIAVAEDLALVERRTQALALQGEVNRDHVRMQQSLLAQALQRCSAALEFVPAITEARQQLKDDLERYKQGTRNDESVPRVEKLARQLDDRCGVILQRLLTHIDRLQAATDAVDAMSAARGIAVDSAIRTTLDKLRHDATSHLKTLEPAPPASTPE